MSMSEERARELTALEPPPSIERIVRFFTELGERISTAGVTDEQNGPGSVGRQAAAFSQNVAGGGNDMGQTLAHWFTILMERYQVRVVDLPEFSLWLAKWYDIRSRTDSIVIHDDDQAPVWGKKAGQGALNAALPAMQIGASLAAPSPADASPTRVYALQRTPSARLPALDDTAADGSVRPALEGTDRRAADGPSRPALDGSVRSTADGSRRSMADGSVRPARGDSGRHASFQKESFSDQPSDGPGARSIGEGVKGTRFGNSLRRPAPVLESSASPSSTAEAPEGPAPRGLSSVAKRRLWTTNLAMGGMLTGSLMQSAQAASADPNAIIVGGPMAAPSPSMGLVGPQTFGQSGLNSPFTPGALPLASLRGKESISGPAQIGQSALVLPPQNVAGLAHERSLPEYARIPASGSTSAKTGAYATVAETAPRSAAVAVGSEKAFGALPIPGASGRGTQTVRDTQVFAAQRANQFLPSVQDGAASGRAGASGPFALARSPNIAGGAVAAAVAATGLDGSGPVFGFTGSPPIDLLRTGGTPQNALRPPHVPGQPTFAQGKAPIPLRPEMGQITLVAPPMHVASEQAEQSGMATAFDWTNLARGAGALDAGGLARLKQALPPGAQAIYPALPPGSLSAGAVNLAVAPTLLGSLLHQGYGPEAAGMAEKVGGMASAALGGRPAAAPLVARIIPGKKPMGDGAGLGHEEGHQQGGPAGALGQAGQASATRGGVLDFLGMPVRLAPSLSGKPELKDEVAVRGGAQAAPGQTVRPNQFASLRSGLFPGSGSVTAEPDKQAWEKAAPHFGLRDASPTTLLAPDARVPLGQSPSSLVSAANSTAPPPAPGSLTSGTFSAGARGPILPTHSAFAPGGGFAPSLATHSHPLSLITGHSPSQPTATLGSAAPAPHTIAGMPAFLGLSGGFGAAPSAGVQSGPTPLALPHSAAPSRFSPGGAQGPGVPGGPAPWNSPTAFGTAPSAHSSGMPSLSAPSFGAFRNTSTGATGTPWTGASPSIGQRLSASPGAPGRAFAPGQAGGHNLSTSGDRSSGGTAPNGSFLSTRPSLSATPGTAAFASNSPTMPAMPSFSTPSLPGMASLHQPAPASAGPGPLSLRAPLMPSPSALTLGQTSNFPLAASIPAPPSAGHAASVMVERAPQMPLAPPSPLAGRASRPEAGTTMVIQRAQTGMPAPASHGGGANAAREGNPGTANAGGGANEVNLLANEVWSLLKRRISWEADRRGRW